MIKQLTL